MMRTPDLGSDLLQIAGLFTGLFYISFHRILKSASVSIFCFNRASIFFNDLVLFYVNLIHKHICGAAMHSYIHLSLER